MTGSNNIEKLRHDFRRMHRTYYSPASYLGEDFELPLSVQLFDRYFWTRPDFASDAVQQKCIEVAAKCKGFNTFWLDAAWFRDGFPMGVGNYVCAKGFPEGLINISKKAHENNMKFMVWFEPERVCEGSDVYADKHDDFKWLLAINDDHPNTRLYNLANPDARQWLLDTLTKFIEDNGIDIYRQDFNMDPIDFWNMADEEGRTGYTENKYIEGLYWLWDSLLVRFPGLFIDNCSSGGRRIDFETCMRSVPLWRSDTGCAPDNDGDHPVATWQQNNTAALSRYIPYHASSSWFEKAYQFRSGSTMGLATAFDFLNDNYDCTAAIASIEELTRIRKYWTGDFYQLTDITNDETVWSAYQLNKNNSGFVKVFRRKDSENSKKVIKLNGLNPNLTYAVVFFDEQHNKTEQILSGNKLISGILVEIPEKKASLLIEYYVK